MAMFLFDNRQHAGEILAKDLMRSRLYLNDPLVLGIPRGGIPVGYSIANAFKTSLDALVLRKLPIPDNPEAGFGAVTLNNTVIVNQQLLARLHLSNSQINAIIDQVFEEVLRRESLYNHDRLRPDLNGRSVILADDGLASGYTMLAGIKYAREQGAGQVIVAVPVAHQIAYNLVEKEADDVFCFHISRASYFAVAPFYKEFLDLSDEDVLDYLEKREQEIETSLPVFAKKAATKPMRLSGS